jgi:hypothetical protein
MSNYQKFKEELQDAKNYYRYAIGEITVLDIENLEEVADKMLETIRCQEEALKWYKGISNIRDNNVVLPLSYFTDKQDPEATKRLRDLSTELKENN